MVALLILSSMCCSLKAESMIKAAEISFVKNYLLHSPSAPPRHASNPYQTKRHLDAQEKLKHYIFLNRLLL